MSTPVATSQRVVLGFDQLGLTEPLLRAVRAEGYDMPTPIQARAIPRGLAGGDVFGAAQTGTGKTAAFVLPMLQRLSARPAPQGREGGLRALILAPTRELAAQIGRSIETYGRHLSIRHAVVFGGVGQRPQEMALRRGVDILVACPGRLVDLIQQGIVHLGGIEILVLDEADRMLDEGFLPAIQRLVRLLPRDRQTLFFSATMPPELRPIADALLRDAERIEVAPVASTPDLIDQSVYFVDAKDKRALLEHVLSDPAVTRALIFTRTKHGADRVARHLEKASVGAEAIHGDRAQGARERALLRFREGRVRVLVATDVAARGIDVDGISHVVNYDMPMDPEGYVHRIGRTARAGASGKAVSFCSADERQRLVRIERLVKRSVPVVQDHPYRDVSQAQTSPLLETGAGNGAARQGARNQQPNRSRWSRRGRWNA